MRRGLLSVTSVSTVTPQVALTFDDGPDPRLTGDVLDVLRAWDVRATFLLVGERVRQHPELARRVVAEGHEVGLHGDTHVLLCGQPFREQRRGLRRGRRDVEAVLGTRLRWFRPPYGKQDPETVLASRVSGMRPLLWSTSALDWEQRGLDEQLAHAARGVRPGAVVLLHDGAAGSEHAPLPATQPELLGQLLAHLAGRHLQPVTMSELCRSGRPVRTAWFEQWLSY